MWAKLPRLLNNKELVCLLSFYAANALAQAPINDNFTNRITLTGTSISNFVSNSGATRETGEPQHSSLPSNSSIWYSWQAPSSGGVEIDASGFDISSPI